MTFHIGNPDLKTVDGTSLKHFKNLQSISPSVHRLTLVRKNGHNLEMQYVDPIKNSVLQVHCCKRPPVWILNLDTHKSTYEETGWCIHQDQQNFIKD